MKSFFSTQLLGLVLPLIVGPLAFFVVQWLKKGITWLDRASGTTKQAFALVMTVFLTVAVKFAGEALPGACILADDARTCLEALTEGDAMKVLLSWLIAQAIHAARKQAEAGTDRYRR